MRLHVGFSKEAVQEQPQLTVVVRLDVTDSGDD